MQLNNSTQARRRAQQDSRFRREESLRYLCPDDPNLPYDMTEVIRKVVDEGNFFEVRVDFGDWIGFVGFWGGTPGLDQAHAPHTYPLR